MKLRFDRETDTLWIRLRDEPIVGSDEIRPGLTVDIGSDGAVVGFDILDGSVQVDDPLTVTLRVSSCAAFAMGGTARRWPSARLCAPCSIRE